MKKAFLTRLSLIVFATAVGQNVFGQHEHQKSYVTEERPINEFHSLVVSGLAEVYLSEGPLKNVKVQVVGMPADDVIVRSADNILLVSTKGNHNGESVKVYVNYRTLHSIEVSGAANLYTQKTIRGENLKLQVFDSGNAEVDICVDDLVIDLRRAGDLKITGKAGRQQIVSIGEEGTLDDSGLVKN
jgi:hypothetical protein